MTSLMHKIELKDNLINVLSSTWPAVHWSWTVNPAEPWSYRLNAKCKYTGNVCSTQVPEEFFDEAVNTDYRDDYFKLVFKDMIQNLGQSLYSQEVKASYGKMDYFGGQKVNFRAIDDEYGFLPGGKYEKMKRSALTTNPDPKPTIDGVDNAGIF